MQKRLECTVSGRVQLVMFRDFVTRGARKLEIVGTVKNNLDGSLSVVAEGEEEKLKVLEEMLHHGPILARVRTVSQTWSTPLGGFKNFDILY